MYSLYVEDKLIYDDASSADDGRELTAAKADLEINKSGSFVFTLYPGHPHYDFIENRRMLVRIEKEGDIFFFGQMIDVELGFYNQKTVTCEGELAFLLDTIQKPYDWLSGENHTTIPILFRYFLKIHNDALPEGDPKRFLAGEVTYSNDKIVRSDTTWMNTLESINKKLIEGFGGYLRTRHEEDGTYIDYLSESGPENTQHIEFGKNLIDIKKSYDLSTIATVVIPLGKKKDETGMTRYDISDIPDTTDESADIQKKGNYIYSKSAVQKYGWIYKTLIYDDDSLLYGPAWLRRQGEAYLKSIYDCPESIELSAADLHTVNKTVESFNIGDKIHVTTKPHSVDSTFIVSKLTVDLLNPSKNKLTLGNTSASLTSQVSGGASAASGTSYGAGGALYSPGTGLSISGNTFNHSNSITAGRIGSSATESLEFGKSFMMPYIDYDSCGHIIGTGVRSLTLPENPDTDKSYKHIQAVPADQWQIAHNLGKYPSVTVIDSSGNTVFGKIEYSDENNITLIFSAAFSGTAYLN